MKTQDTTTENSKKSKDAPAASRFLAGLLGVIFIFCALVGLVSFDIWRVVFNPPLVKQVLITEFVSSDIVPAILQVFSEQRARQRVESGESLSGVSEPDIVLLISYVDIEGWRKIKQLLLTDEFITHLISVSVDGLYQWVDSSDLWPTFVWEMTPLKERVTGEQGVEAIQVAYLSMPVCTATEVADLEKRLSEMPPGVEVLYNLCQFPDPWHDDQVSDYQNSLIDINQNVPLQFNFGEMLSQNPAANPLQVKSQLRLVRSVAQWGWLATLLVLFSILGLAVRSLRSLGLFVGIPLTITGLLALLTAWQGQNAVVQFVIDTFLAQTSPFVQEEIARSLQRLTGEFFQPLLIQGIILAVIGAVLIAVIFIKNQPAEVKTEQP